MLLFDLLCKSFVCFNPGVVFNVNTNVKQGSMHAIHLIPFKGNVIFVNVSHRGLRIQIEWARDFGALRINVCFITEEDGKTGENLKDR